MPRRAHTVSVVLVTILLLAVMPSVAHAAAKGRYAIGDSVMLGAEPRLENRGFVVNASISRQVADGIELLRRKARNGSLRTNVVVHLGTNGTFSRSQCRAMRSAVGTSRRLFLVTVKVPRSWEEPNNRVIRRCAARYRNTHLVDWRKLVSRHSGLVEADGYHLTPRGARRYTALVDRTVDRVVG